MLLVSRNLGQSREQHRPVGRGLAIGPFSEVKRSTTALRGRCATSSSGRPRADRPLFNAVRLGSDGHVPRVKAVCRRTTTTITAL